MDAVKMMDKRPSSKIGLHYPFSVYELQVENLLRKPSYRVMGRIDLFALLNSLLPGFVDSLDFKSMRNNQFLCEVF